MRNKVYLKSFRTSIQQLTCSRYNGRWARGSPLPPPYRARWAAAPPHLASWTACSTPGVLSSSPAGSPWRRPTAAAAPQLSCLDSPAVAHTITPMIKKCAMWEKRREIYAVLLPYSLNSAKNLILTLPGINIKYFFLNILNRQKKVNWKVTYRYIFKLANAFFKPG